VIDGPVRHGYPHEAIAVGRAVGGAVVEDVDVLGREVAGVIPQPDREEDRFVTHHGEHGGPPAAIGCARLAPAPPQRLEELDQPMLSLESLDLDVQLGLGQAQNASGT
jgi:hypothetical protein